MAVLMDAVSLLSSLNLRAIACRRIATRNRYEGARGKKSERRERAGKRRRHPPGKRSVVHAWGAEMPAAKYAASLLFSFFSLFFFLLPSLSPRPPHLESAPDLPAVAPSCRPQSPLK